MWRHTPGCSVFSGSESVMGCDLQEHRARIGTWTSRIRECVASGSCVNVRASSGCILTMCALGFTVLCALLIIGGVEQNPGPDVQTKVNLSCAACFNPLHSGEQCDNCGSWFHVRCNTDLREKMSMKWLCIVCTSNVELHAKEIIKDLETELKRVKRIIHELVLANSTLQWQLFKQKNSARNENKILQVETRPETFRESKKTVNPRVDCLIIGDSTVCCVEESEISFRVECFPGIRAEQMKQIIETRKYGTPGSVILHVGTNDAGGPVDILTGDIYDLVKLTLTKFPNSNVVLSGVIRRRDLPWQCIRLINGNFEWVARCLGVLFVNPNSWLYEEDLEVDGVHLNRNGARRLGNLYSRICQSIMEKPLFNDNLRREKSIIENLRTVSEVRDKGITSEQSDCWTTTVLELTEGTTIQGNNTPTAGSDIDKTTAQNNSRVKAAKGENRIAAKCVNIEAAWKEEKSKGTERSDKERNESTLADNNHATTECVHIQTRVVQNESSETATKNESRAPGAYVQLPRVEQNNDEVATTEQEGQVKEEDEKDDGATAGSRHLTEMRDEHGVTAACYEDRMRTMWNSDQETAGWADEKEATWLFDDWAKTWQSDVWDTFRLKMRPIGAERHITSTPEHDGNFYG